MEFKTPLKSKGPFLKISKFDLIGSVQWVATNYENDEVYLLSFKYLEDQKDFVPGNEIYIYDTSGKYKATLILPFDAKFIGLYKDYTIFALDADEDKLRKCLILKRQ